MSRTAKGLLDFAATDATDEKGGAPVGGRPHFQDFAMLKVMEAAPTHKTPNITSTVEVVTPAVARHLRDTAHFDRQRDIAPANVDRLANEMLGGRFTPGTQIYICVLPDGSELIVNGNHTLEGIVACGIPQVMTVTRKAVADENEAGKIYAVFDIQRVRTWRDSLRATGMGEGIPLADKALSALGVLEKNFAHVTRKAESRIGRITHLEEYRDSAVMLASALDGAPNESGNLVKRAAIMAVALETIRYQPSFGTEFWGRVAHDEGLTNSMPEKALLSWLRNARAAGGQASQREHCRAAALAWNAGFKHEPRTYVKPNAMAAFFLLGTPWANGFAE